MLRHILNGVAFAKLIPMSGTIEKLARFRTNANQPICC